MRDNTQNTGRDSETNAECASVIFSSSGMLLSLDRDLQLIYPKMTIEFSGSTTM